MNTISTLDSLSQILTLRPEEMAWDGNCGVLPIKISAYLKQLITESEAVRRQYIPTLAECSTVEGDFPDPLSEEAHETVPRLIHRYENRAAFLVTDICAAYCRHCFRRRFTGTFQGPATREEVRAVANYLAEHKEIRELLLTGGDPLTLGIGELEEMIACFRSIRPDLVLRVCTRVPFSDPSRITSSLISMLQRHNSSAIFAMVQCNHPDEITAESRAAISRFVDGGIPVFNQSVLLKGINDSADVLEELCNTLVSMRVKPHYLFQGDLVVGTAHFRVPLNDGFQLEAELRRRLSGLAMPTYAVDLPGGGKIPLVTSYLIDEQEGVWKFRNTQGEEYLYFDAKKDSP